MEKMRIFSAVFSFLAFLFFNVSYAQDKGVLSESLISSNQSTISSDGVPFVDAGTGKTINCGESCTTISANFLDVGESDKYTVQAIPFHPPISFNGLANSLNPDIDDSWSAVETIPFDFCFFGAIENQFQIGSNGVIRFDVNPTDVGLLSNNWMFSQNIPNNAVEALSEANVFTPGHDLNPKASLTEEIGWEIIGKAPNRKLVISYYEVPIFGCDWYTATHMAVFYETTNIIEIYIKLSPTCSTNNFSAVVGIQNNEGTKAYAPPGRNTDSSPWTTENEAWRFVPSGESTVDFKWLDATGTVVGTTPVLEVCPSSTTTYTAQLSYRACNGNMTVLKDSVVVEVQFDAPPQPELDAVYYLCKDKDSRIISLWLETQLNEMDYQFTWYFEGLLIPNAKASKIEAENQGVYTVRVKDVYSGCSLEQTANVILSEPPRFYASVSNDFNSSYTVTVTPHNDGNYKYQLDGGAWQTKPEFLNVPRGLHIISGRDINGCGTLDVQVLVVNFPRYFTPNNDGYNDLWTITPFDNIKIEHIKIYDRFGKYIAFITAGDRGWDGTFKGKQLPPADYWFVLYYEDVVSGNRREFKNHFTLKR